MILSGSNRSATWRAKRRIRCMGMSAPRYQRADGPFDNVLSLEPIRTYYPWQASAGRSGLPIAIRRIGFLTCHCLATGVKLVRLEI